MRKIYRQTLALLLVLMTVVGMLSGCAANKPVETTAPVETEPAEEAKVLKVLTLGHSLGVNAGHMLNAVAAAEGYEHMVIGTLYYSGCPLHRHVEFLQNNSPEYVLYISSTETAGKAPQAIENCTMLMALQFDYWDVIVMMGSNKYLVKEETYTNGNIQIIQNYVNEHKKNPNAVFAWNMPWVGATDPTMTTEERLENFKPFDYDRRKYFEALGEMTRKYILTDETFTCIIPTGAAVENAISSYMTEKDLICDYAHATDLGRAIAGYAYFCTLTGIEKLEEIKMDAIPASFVRTSEVAGDRPLSDSDKELMLECINNALANPTTITESQFKQAPEGYIPIGNHDG